MSQSPLQPAESRTEPANLEAVTDQSPKAKRTWGLIVAFLVLAALGLWLHFTPPGFWVKLRMVAYAFCHQMPAHSLFDGHLQFPLCARCTGMYLGSLIGLILGWVQGRRQGFPPLWVWLVFAFFFLAFAFDGINSTLGVLPGFNQVYPSQNWLRLLTGFGMGLVMASLLWVAFNQTVWAEHLAAKIYADGRYLLLGLLLSAGLATLSLFGPSLLKQTLMILSVLGLLCMLTIIYTIPMTLLIYGQSKLREARSLLLPVTLALLLVITQISLFSYLRFLLTGTLEPFNL